MRPAPRRGSREYARETYDMLLGIVGFFVLAFVVITFVSEVTGARALSWSVITILFAAALWLVWRLRKRALARFGASDER